MDRCRKCGCESVAVQYKRVYNLDCLWKKCAHCEYTWTEPTRDAKDGGDDSVDQLLQQLQEGKRDGD